MIKSFMLFICEVAITAITIILTFQAVDISVDFLVNTFTDIYLFVSNFSLFPLTR